MPVQRNTITLDENEKLILSLEKKYFQKIKDIILSNDFINDLKLIEKEISDNYTKFDNLWNLKNKIKVPAERVVRHHLYTKLRDIIKGIFPSPLSSDFGIKTDDAIICVDIKTIDTKNNSGDLKSTCVEKNQNSFLNTNYQYIKVPANMNAIEDYSRLPVLTYIVKIVYHDNNIQFKLSRNTYPTIVIACIPNGKLSRLFDYNIVDNIKAYDYFSESNDGPQYKPIILPNNILNNQSAIDNLCAQRNLTKIHIVTLNKDAYIDPANNGTIWWKTTFSKKPVIAPVKSAGSTRYNNDILKERYDENNAPWIGYIEYTI